MIWKNPIDLAIINQIGQNTLSEHIGIEFTEAGDDYLKATMPVDHRTKQPMGLLHGGASVVLAESMGSIASILAAGAYGSYSAVGVEINANHVKSARSGFVTGIVKPIKIGKSIHVWNIEISDGSGDLVCVSRLTVSVKEMKM